MVHKERGHRGINPNLGRHAGQTFRGIPPGFIYSTAAMIQESTPLDKLLDQDQDLDLYQRELRLAQGAQKFDDVLIELLKLASRAGVSDRGYMTYLSRTRSTEEALIRFLAEILPGIIQRPIFKGEIKKIRGDIGKLLTNGEVVADSDDIDVININTSQGVGLLDTMLEVRRVKGEKIGLLQLQIDWLRNHPDRTSDIGRPIEGILSDDDSPQMSDEPQFLVTEDGQQPNLLAGWNLFWTNRQFSSNPDDLVAISTSDRSATLREFAEISRGIVSVKPGSIVRALEFHLQKDVIQKALAMRNKYVPVEMRDWIKLKRGKDRIFLLIPQERTAIFSVHGRDEAYESLKR